MSRATTAALILRRSYCFDVARLPPRLTQPARLTDESNEETRGDGRAGGELTEVRRGTDGWTYGELTEESMVS